MLATNITKAIADLQQKWSLADYNFSHFRTKHIVADTLATIARRGVQPGELAPDFTLPDVEGGSLTLSHLRGSPALLRFGSAT